MLRRYEIEKTPGSGHRRARPEAHRAPVRGFPGHYMPDLSRVERPPDYLGRAHPEAWHAEANGIGPLRNRLAELNGLSVLGLAAHRADNEVMFMLRELVVAQRS